MRAGRIILAALVALAVCGPLRGQSLSQQQEKKSRIEKDIAILRDQINSNSNKSEQALSTLSIIQAQLDSRKKLIQETDAIIKSYNSQISQIQADIKKKQANLDTLQAHYSRLVLGAYKNRDIKLWYMYVLSAENIAQAFRRFGYFKNLSSQMKNQAERIEEAKALLEVRKSELVSARAEAQKVRKAREDEMNKLKADQKQQQKLVDKLKKDKKAYQASLKSKQDEIKALDKLISKMIADATKGKSASGSKKKVEVDYTLDSNFEKNKGKLPWPVEGPVTEHFGTYRNAQLKITLNNNGINIATEADSKVKCVFDGVVSNVMLAPGYGQCILVQHGNYYTTYCKVKNATVRQGDKVVTGQVIGEVATIMGKTQLNFLIYNKKYLDPEKWLRPR